MADNSCASHRLAALSSAILAAGCGGCVSQPEAMPAAQPPPVETTVYFYPGPSSSTIIAQYVFNWASGAHC